MRRSNAAVLWPLTGVCVCGWKCWEWSRRWLVCRNQMQSRAAPLLKSASAWSWILINPDEGPTGGGTLAEHTLHDISVWNGLHGPARWPPGFSCACRTFPGGPWVWCWCTWKRVHVWIWRPAHLLTTGRWLLPQSWLPLLNNKWGGEEKKTHRTEMSLVWPRWTPDWCDRTNPFNPWKPGCVYHSTQKHHNSLHRLFTRVGLHWPRRNQVRFYSENHHQPGFNPIYSRFFFFVLFCFNLTNIFVKVRIKHLKLEQQSNLFIIRIYEKTFQLKRWI